MRNSGEAQTFLRLFNESPSLTQRERLFLSVGTNSDRVNTLVRAEHERLTGGGRADYRTIVAESHASALGTTGGPKAPLYQLLGSHNPYHFGHRVMIYSLLKAGLLEQGSAVVTTMGVNKKKLLSLDSYARRYLGVVRQLAMDPVLRTAPVSALDLPTGVGASTNPLFQSALIAALADDSVVRVVMGSDKFLLDMDLFQQGDRYAIAKYLAYDRRHYVVVRQESSPTEIKRRLDEVPELDRNRVIILPKVDYGHELASSSTRVKKLLASVSFEDRLLGRVLTDGALENVSELIGRDSVIHPTLINVTPQKALSDEHTVSWRYDSQHGCIRKIITCNDN